MLENTTLATVVVTIVSAILVSPLDLQLPATFDRRKPEPASITQSPALPPVGAEELPVQREGPRRLACTVLPPSMAVVIKAGRVSVIHAFVIDVTRV